MVYSVGMDGVDDAGADYHSTTPLELFKERTGATVDQYVGDISFHLTPQTRPTSQPDPKAEE